MGAKKNICELKTYIPMTPAVNTTGKTVSGDLPENQGSFVHEDLGKQLVSGVETIGVRDARTYNGFKVTDIRQTAAPEPN